MTNDPFAILGVPREATMPEIEVHYRLLLRTYHPDLHHSEGPAAVAEAEARTRQINWAMAAIRGASGSPRTTSHGTRDGKSPGGPSRASPGGGSRTGSDRWVGNNPFGQPPSDPSGSGPGRADDRGAGATGSAGAGGWGPGRVGDPPWAEYDWFGNRIDRGPNDAVPCPFCGRPFDELGTYQAHLERSHHYRRLTAKRQRRGRSRFVRAIGSLRFVPIWLVVLLSFAVWFMFGFYAFTAGLSFVALILWTQTSPRFRNR